MATRTLDPAPYDLKDAAALVLRGGLRRDAEAALIAGDTFSEDDDKDAKDEDEDEDVDSSQVTTCTSEGSDSMKFCAATTVACATAASVVPSVAPRSVLESVMVAAAAAAALCGSATSKGVSLGSPDALPAMTRSWCTLTLYSATTIWSWKSVHSTDWPSAAWPTINFDSMP